MKKAIVIGSGFAGLSAACCLAREGVEVTVLEKNSSAGGRARILKDSGFTWDMGPSWYWMPDVFEKFFALFNKKPSDYYQLVRLNPSYQVIWKDECVQIPADMQQLEQLFESYETGSALQLRKFLKEAGTKYETAMKELVYKPGLTVREFINLEVVQSLFKMDLLQSVARHARTFFTHPKLLQLVEFPILFLGALPRNTPALYTLMNYADMVSGTWYPMGGMVQVADAMLDLASELGVRFRYDEAVTALIPAGNRISKVTTTKAGYEADIIIAASDYHHSESLLPAKYRNYSEAYWSSRTMAPSSLIYFLGIDTRLNGLLHHNLFFDAPFEQHASELYSNPAWPADPLMYVCAPSRTDPYVAPAGCENLFVLIPVAAGMIDDPEIRNRYKEIMLDRISKHLGMSLHEHVLVCRSYAGSDFINDYNSFKGNAYGLANTLKQTAILKPSIRNKKLKNLFYAGQLTVPGPGVPPAIISGQIVAQTALKSTSTLMKLQSA